MMGDAAKPCFARRNKERGILNEEDFQKCAFRHDYQVTDDYGNGHSNKMDVGIEKRKGALGHYGTSPRKGAHGVSNHPNSSKNTVHNQGMRINETSKDQIKKWVSDSHHANLDSWKEYRATPRVPLVIRARKDSSHECESPGNRNGRKQLQRDKASEDLSDRKGNSETKKHRKPRRSRRIRKEENDQEEDMDGPVIDESLLTAKELLGLQQAEERLKRDFIYRLRKRPRSYPTAKYTCKLCDTLIESVAFAHKHIKEKRHKKNIKEKQEQQLLTALPPPTPLQIEAIGVAIEKVVQEFGLNNEDFEQRLGVKAAMESALHQKLPDCSLRLYGSSCSRFGFKNSDVNLDVQFPADMSQPDVLLLVQESLKNSESFVDVDADFHARVPVVVCKEKQSGLVCRVSAGNENACLTTNHLAKLGKLEPSLVSLVIAFRHWAKLCCADRPEEGGLPPYAFALMVIFFLQQRKEPFLPVYLGSWIGGFSLNKLVNFNLKEVEDDIVVWEHNPAVEDPGSSKETSPKRGKVPLVFDSDHQCLVPVGQLWVELLRFYALEFNLADLVISIRLKEKVSRESKDWPKKRIAVEDPYSVKRNVARTLNSQLVYEYILHCLRATYKYFALPHKQSAKNNQKRPAESLVLSEPEKSTLKPGIPDIQNAHDEAEKSPMDSCVTASMKSSYFPQDPVLDPSQVFGAESFVEEQLADDIEHLGVTHEDSDCIIEEFISGDNEEYKPSCEETESGNEEEEEEEDGHERGRKWQGRLGINQGLDEDSESGDLAVPASERDVETDSISDMENFQNMAAAFDGFGSECGGGLDDKVDMDEESTEGTDELDDSLIKLEPATQEQVFEMDNSDEEEVEEEEEEEEEEEVHSIINQRQLGNVINTEDELDNTYTGSGAEEPLSEEEELFISVKYEDSEFRKNDDEPPRADLDKEDNAEKEVSLESSMLIDQCGKSEFFYEFNKYSFTKGKSPTVVCSLCKREGHLKRDCPEDFKKIELDPLPPLTPKFLNTLDQVCTQCYKDFAPNIIEDQAREYIRQNLENFIRQEFPGTKLNLFGSSKNGFGFKQSDLDICMTVDGLETAEGLDCIRIIEELARVLKKHSGLRNILPITTAKVPIVKFFHVRSGLEVDISLYNTLALHNTRLLSSYAAIDPRVKYLCYTMKVFTKMCDIGDASRGSLSSYAYTLMVLYFLQQRSPPVIPVLQEIYQEPKKPEILVDGWNVYFFDKTDELPAVWPDFGKNKESIGELWLGLLRFYTEEFDFKEHVICIRRKSLLTTFKKQWTSKYIVIEDPFDLNHNLGAGLSRKMTNFIMKAFINGRRVFGTPVRGFPKEYSSKMEYFFDPEVLTEGELAPNDRCCRICGKIGHFMKDCPMRRKPRRRHESEDLKNQRYTENKEKRSKEEKETPAKMAERDVSLKDGRLQICTPNKNKLGRGPMESPKEKTPKQPAEKWKRQEDREKRCFICGREGHIKKECPQHKAAGALKLESQCGSPLSSAVKHSGRLNQGLLLQEEKKKQKGRIFLSPQSGSLSSKYMTQGKASQKRPHQDS